MLKPKPNSFYFLFFLILCMFLTACGGSATEGTTSYIATIENAPASARVGLVAENGKFVLYICSLDDAFNLANSRWYTGNLDGDGTFAGTSPDGVKVNGAIIGDSFSGFITTLQGERLPFRGSVIPANGPAGLYRGVGEYDGQSVIVGAVVDEAELFVATTVQVQGTTQFISPVITPAFRVDSTKMILTFGDLNQKVDLLLVSSLEGIE